MLSCFARAIRALLQRAVLFALAPLIMWMPQVRAQQPEPAAQLTLTEAIDRTLAQNPELAVFRFRDAALAGKVQTAALRPPLELGAELENFGGEGGSDEAELTVSLSSVIELGGKRAARMGAVSARRDLLLAEAQAVALDLLGEVIRRYVEVLAAQARLALARDSVALAGDTLGAVQRRVKAAASPRAEALRARAALAQARLAVQSEERQVEYHKLALASLWGGETSAFRLESAELYRFPPSAGFAELYSLAQQNPAIARFASEERLRAAELRLAETQSSLDIGWSAGIRRSREIDETTLVAGFELPLFPARRNSGAIATAIAERERVAVEREAALLRLKSGLFRAVNGREQALASVQVLRDSVVPTLREALVEVERAYRRGRYSYLEWASAREELIGARRAQIEAAAAALRFGAEIEQMTAAPLVPAGAEPSK
ncbi:TolC family protein [Microbulbifer rhizosphaerae]|uniref:Cobalt-zinc-cadmium efflux system outer membrane protein n=1 Tax=Microbulbifer rhizosphaerae TaxID=1562603 RepID=A0A7W4ZAI2_9GAMM|nr:TolC family protein [Microbulbifer rhizosphaerae]MBB3061315.1 cobalt-zinc-cadmium efflux system outer membrane protein [Microbulbifer rhizosphaerae]